MKRHLRTDKMPPTDANVSASPESAGSPLYFKEKETRVIGTPQN